MDRNSTRLTRGAPNPAVSIPPDAGDATGLLAQFLRFVGVGAITTAIQYGVLWGGVSAFRVPAAWASAGGYALGVLLSYVLNYVYTFRSGKSHLDAAPKFFAIFGIGWCINLALMALFVHVWSWNVWPSQVVTTAIGLVWNFFGSRWWTFRQNSS